MSSELLDEMNSQSQTESLNKVNKIKADFDRINKAHSKVLDHFYDIETECDNEECSDDVEIMGRRKKWTTKDFDFVSVADSDCQNDISEIFGGSYESKIKGNNRNFKKNDIVVCLLDKKKYKGVIFQINQTGFVVKTKDRKKIKIAWGSPEEARVQLFKSKSAL